MTFSEFTKSIVRDISRNLRIPEEIFHPAACGCAACDETRERKKVERVIDALLFEPTNGPIATMFVKYLHRLPGIIPEHTNFRLVLALVDILQRAELGQRIAVYHTFPRGSGVTTTLAAFQHFVRDYRDWHSILLVNDMQTCRAIDALDVRPWHGTIFGNSDPRIWMVDKLSEQQKQSPQYISSFESAIARMRSEAPVIVID